MKKSKKEQEKEVRAIIDEIIRQDRERKSNQCQFLKMQMLMEEEALKKTLDKDQWVLYDKFCEKRDVFYKFVYDNYGILL